MDKFEGMNERDRETSEFNRRDFLKGGSLATVMTMLGGVELLAQTAANNASETKLTGSKVKCAVIGLGAWGREILDQLGRLPQAEIVAICDNYAAMLRRSAGKAPGAVPTEDYRTILDNQEIRAVVVATPTHQHRDIAVAALRAGKHVYCEAPLANTIEDARAIAIAAQKAVGKVFQPGLHLRSDPQRHFLLPFIRSGALGKPVLARAQWHRKQSWRSASPNPDREKELNWRLDKSISLGLAGEVGIHQLDQAGWFLNAEPSSVTGFGAVSFWRDGREVPDTAQVVVEYPGGLRLIHDSTLANSFDADYELFFGSDAAVMIRESKAWMFKEVDSPLLGWEVYARKDAFYKETGIALVANATKQAAIGEKATDESPFPYPTLYYALDAFLGNCAEIEAAVDDFKATFDSHDTVALEKYLATISRRPAANYKEGFHATVLAIKANDAVIHGERIVLKREWFELA